MYGQGKAMELEEALTRVLRSYRRYYDLNTEHVEPPFTAEAEYHSHEEHYFLTKRAVIDEIENHEIVYFAVVLELNSENFAVLDRTAWERGIAKAKPSIHHQSTDVSLVILAERIEEDLFRRIKKTKHSVSYKRLLHGYSNYHLIAMELSSGRIVYNRLGYSMKRILKSIR